MATGAAVAADEIAAHVSNDYFQALSPAMDLIVEICLNAMA